MANQVIWTAGYHRLARLDLNDARGKAIDGNDPNDQPESNHYDGLGEQYKPKRHGAERVARPAKTVVEAGNENS
jgi:hypothetical protein